jgi:hypothetical protein
MLVRGKIAFTNRDKSWEETFDVVEILASLMNERGIFATRDNNSLTLDTSGYIISPLLTSFRPLEPRGVQTVTIIRVRHPTLAPNGLFEYQHSTGENTNDAIRKGFDQWAQVDLVVLLDALETQPQRCTRMEMTFPAQDGQPERHRRIILGPVAHLRQQKEPPPGEEPEEHPFCPCCLLTRSFEAFKPMVESNEFLGLRLFAMREENGQASADCRVNGEDFEAGKQALRAYVRTWPARGVEFRKQYVIMQTVAGPAGDPND